METLPTEEGVLTFQNEEELVAYLKKARKGKAKKKFAPLFSSDKAEWETPDHLFVALDAEFHFDVDVCATFENRKVQKYFSIEQDAFRLQWRGTCWMNPPYGDGIGKWLEKARKSVVESGATVVCLVPSRTDTSWWRDNAPFGEVRFITSRLKFKGAPTSAPFPSALIIFRPGFPTSYTYWRYATSKIEPFYIAERLA